MAAADPLTGLCNAIEAISNLEAVKIAAMTAKQKEDYLQPQVNAVKSIDKTWQDLVQRVIDLTHPAAPVAVAK